MNSRVLALPSLWNDLSPSIFQVGAVIHKQVYALSLLFCPHGRKCLAPHLALCMLFSHEFIMFGCGRHTRRYWDMMRRWEVVAIHVICVEWHYSLSQQLTFDYSCAVISVWKIVFLCLGCENTKLYRYPINGCCRSDWDSPRLWVKGRYYSLANLTPPSALSLGLSWSVSPHVW